jgi:hypothetical protein
MVVYPHFTMWNGTRMGMCEAVRRADK